MASDRSKPTEERKRLLAEGALSRGSKLLSLPLGYAGRRTVALTRRARGHAGTEVNAELQRRTADQIFTVLGELKGGAMKFGQALSLFEAVLPEDIAGPYRARLRQLQDSAPPMPTSRVHAVLAKELGPDWRDLFSDFSVRPAAAASIGQVHKGVWKADGRPVAVKIQYPGADNALRSDLRQIGRLANMISPLAGGMDVKPLVKEMTERVGEEVDYDLEAAAQEQAASGFDGDEEFVVPHVLANTKKVMVSEWIKGRALSTVADDDQLTRNRHALSYVRFLFAAPSKVGLLHADPHPGNFRILDDGRLGVVDFGLVARLPEGLPSDMGRLLRYCVDGDAQSTRQGLEELGFVSGAIDTDELFDYLGPFVEPAAVDEFHFTRDWMRAQFTRVTSPEAQTLARRLNLPPSYLIIHRVWMGGIAVICQLDSRARFGAVLDEFLPGFADPVPR